MLNPEWPKRIVFGPCQNVTGEWPENWPLAKQNRIESHRVFGLQPKPARMFRDGFYARVSTHDQLQ
jgi:hypothetical protein